MHFHLSVFTVGQEWRSFHPLDPLPHPHFHLSSLVFGFELFPLRPEYRKTSWECWWHVHAPLLTLTCVCIKANGQIRTLLHFRNLAPARAAAKPPPTPPPSGGGGVLGVMPPGEGGGGGAGGHDAEEGGGPGGGGGAGGAGGGGGGAGEAEEGLVGAAGTRAASEGCLSFFMHSLSCCSCLFLSSSCAEGSFWAGPAYIRRRSSQMARKLRLETRFYLWARLRWPPQSQTSWQQQKLQHPLCSQSSTPTPVWDPATDGSLLWLDYISSLL